MQIEVSTSAFWAELAMARLSVKTQLQGLAEGYRLHNVMYSARPAHPLFDAAAVHIAAAVRRSRRHHYGAAGPGPSRMPLWLALEKRRCHSSSLVQVADEDELFPLIIGGRNTLTDLFGRLSTMFCLTEPAPALNRAAFKVGRLSNERESCKQSSYLEDMSTGQIAAGTTWTRCRARICRLHLS